MKRLKSLADFPVLDFRGINNSQFSSVAKYLKLDYPNIVIDDYNVFVIYPTAINGLVIECSNIIGTKGLDDGSGDPDITGIIWNANGTLEFDDGFTTVDGTEKTAAFN